MLLLTQLGEFKSNELLMINRKKFEKKILTLIHKKKYDEALELVEIERFRTKSQAFFYAMYGIINIYMSNYYEAKLFLNKAINLNANDVTALYAMSFLLLREKRYKEALKAYITILNYDPNYKRADHKINKFKNDQKLKKYVSKLTPDKYFMDKNIRFSTFQKLLSISLVSLIIIILASVFFKENYSGLAWMSTGTGNNILKQRENYKEILYLTTEELRQKKNLLRGQNKNYNNKVITLNELLSSSLSLEEKIKLDHYQRRDIYQQQFSPAILPVNINEISTFPAKYDDVYILVNGTMIKKVNDNRYLINYKKISLEVLDNKQISNYIGKEKIKGQLKNINKKIKIDLIEVLD